GRNLPWGSHHASAMAANFAVSAGSMLALRGSAGSLSLGAEESLMTCAPTSADFPGAALPLSTRKRMDKRRLPGNRRTADFRPRRTRMAQQPKKPRLVMKFGGTSVGDVERIRAVARRVKREADAGAEVAVVVSAMAGATNQLVDWVRDISRFHDAREYDAV